ncbi:MAG: heparinase II/III family protein [Shimia sp.]
MTRLAARFAGRGRTATGFVSQPEPRSIGSYARGKQLIGGNFLMAGFLVEGEGRAIWDLEPPAAAFEEELHGFAWLDDLSAVGDADARALAQAWTHDWVRRYAAGTGPGWTPDLTGRRLIRWINHALVLLSGQERATSDAFYRSLARQTHFLSRRWSSTTPGLPRIEALTGLIYAAISLTGMEGHIGPAIDALGRECDAQVDAGGAIASRNPEELLEVFTLLTWAALAITESGRIPATAHVAAIERIAPTLRTLRHVDGGLARFHGGGRGLEGRLDQALADSATKAGAPGDMAMGYARLACGRTSVLLDAAPPPGGRTSFNAHASTLALEVSSGRRPLIVNCGPGAAFGDAWRRAGRATPSHSTLAIDGYSSSRLAEVRRLGGRDRELLADTPREVLHERTRTEFAERQQASHDGYRATHGLTHARTVELANDGRGLAGEDLLMALEPADVARFDARMTETDLQGVAYAIRFHIHPDVDAHIDMNGSAVSLALKSGEIWVFRHDGRLDLALEPSVYLEAGRLKPRAAEQIVLSGRASATMSRVRWSLAKAQETPLTMRDFRRDDPRGDLD